MHFPSSSQPKDQKFEFPDLFPKEKEEEQEKQKKQVKILEREYKRITRLHNHRHGVPGWFGVQCLAPLGCGTVLEDAKLDWANLNHHGVKKRDNGIIYYLEMKKTQKDRKEDTRLDQANVHHHGGKKERHRQKLTVN